MYIHTHTHVFTHTHTHTTWREREREKIIPRTYSIKSTGLLLPEKKALRILLWWNWMTCEERLIFEGFFQYNWQVSSPKSCYEINHSISPGKRYWASTYIFFLYFILNRYGKASSFRYLRTPLMGKKTEIRRNKQKKERDFLLKWVIESDMWNPG